jgi:O-antigen/teichoic acid export membrane protein
MTLLACIGVIYTGWGVVGVIIAVAGAALVARLINIVVLFIWEKPWLLPHPRFFDARLLLGTIKQSIGLFILSCASLAIFQVDKLIIAHFLGQDEVAHYSVVGRPFMLVFGVYVMVIGPLWPAHGEALRRGDLHWVRRALQLSSLFGVASVMACGAVMFFFGDQILRVWTRGNLVHASRALVLAMTALFCVWTWLGALSALLNSAGILRAQMWFIGAHAVLNIALALMLVRWYGSTGVAWSISIAGLFTSIWGYPWLLRRHIFSRVPTATS